MFYKIILRPNKPSKQVLETQRINLITLHYMNYVLCQYFLTDYEILCNKVTFYAHPDLRGRSCITSSKNMTRAQFGDDVESKRKGFSGENHKMFHLLFRCTVWEGQFSVIFVSIEGGISHAKTRRRIFDGLLRSVQFSGTSTTIKNEIGLPFPKPHVL